MNFYILSVYVLLPFKIVDFEWFCLLSINENKSKFIELVIMNLSSSTSSSSDSG